MALGAWTQQLASQPILSAQIFTQSTNQAVGQPWGILSEPGVWVGQVVQYPVQPQIAPPSLWGGWGYLPQWETVYAVILANNLPLVGLALPLSDRLLPATQDKICHREFTDFFSLLFKWLEKKDKDYLEVKDKERLESRTENWTWANWVSGFL